MTRNYVEDDCVAAYASGRVAYARDAFDGLHLMDKVTGNGFDDYLSHCRQSVRVRRATQSETWGVQMNARSGRSTLPKCRRGAGG